jgi:ABC-type sugar transport system substrate-binding protein
MTGRSSSTRLGQPLVWAFLLGALFGCEERPPYSELTEGPSDTTLTVAYVLPNDGPYYDLKWEGVRSQLEEYGYRPERFSSHGYANRREQLGILENLVARRVRGIILHPVNSTLVVPVVEEAADKGITVIAENLDVESAQVAGRVMLANYEIGWELAMTLASRLGGAGRIVALVGPRGQAQAAEMWEAATTYLSKFPQIEVIREELLPANPDAAMRLTESILATSPDVDGIYTWYVQNAVGAATAVKRLGRPPGRVVIVTKDINERGEQLLREGYIHGMLVGEPIEMGRQSARLLHDVIQGRQPDPLVQMRNFLVTIENIDAIDRSGFERQPD